MTDYLDVEEAGISAEERERRERFLADLKKPIGPGDSADMVMQKCHFQNSIKYEYSPPRRDFIEHLMPSRRENDAI